MKNKKFSRVIALAAAAALSMGCITMNAFAGEFTSGGEAEVVNEPAADLGGDLFGDGTGTEEPVVEDVVPEENAAGDDLEGFDLFQDGASEGTEDGAAFSDTEGVFGDETEPEVTTQAAIVLNYDEYVFHAVGETVLLAATVSGVESAEEPVEEPAAEEEIVEEEETETEVFGAEEPVAELQETEAAAEESVEEPASPAADAVVWSSSDAAVAAVDENGLVSAVAAGEAIITCTLAADQNVTAVCKVTVETGCELPEHVHSFEDCLVRELICDHVSEEEHTAQCFNNYWKCGMEEHVHNEECFENTEESQEVVEEVVETEVFTSN